MTLSHKSKYYAEKVPLDHKIQHNLEKTSGSTEKERKIAISYQNSLLLYI